MTRDRDAVRQLFTGDPLVRRHGNDLFKSAFGERSVMLLDPAEHVQRRRLELPPFHGQAVQSYTERIRKLVTTESRSWNAGQVVVTQPRARGVTMEIILELVLGVGDPDLQAELAAIFDSFNTPLSKLALFLPTTLGRRAWWNPISKPAYARVEQMRALLGAHIARTRADPTLGDRGDVLAVLVRARDQNGQALSDVDLRDELVTLVAAGHETTATAMAWACDLLAHHPDVVTRLRQTLAAANASTSEQRSKSYFAYARSSTSRPRARCSNHSKSDNGPSAPTPSSSSTPKASTATHGSTPNPTSSDPSDS